MTQAQSGQRRQPPQTTIGMDCCLSEIGLLNLEGDELFAEGYDLIEPFEQNAAHRGPSMSRCILGLATAEQRPNLRFPITPTIFCGSINPTTIAQDRYAAALGGLKSLFAMNFYKER
jgi:hypothetical protein